MAYCVSRFQTVRRRTVEVRVGGVGVGGDNPIRLQSMTTSDTQDVAATVRQSIALVEAGCEIVRVTAPNVAAARCLREIRAQFTAAGFGHVPLVADIHFLPQAAMEAVEHVEKVRVNPGNYADKKKFAVREYTGADYERELQRLHEAFSPLVLRCKALGRALRIGVNHGSLSDRIMNRYGDTPLGMVESALEFVRICESHDYHGIVFSMKASNPKVMIQACRLLVDRLDAAHRPYPLHLGVTEAGDGEDGRIKSAIGIGSLLLDGLGDTIRVSLTEDSVEEIPVARAIAAKAMSRWKPGAGDRTPESDGIDPYRFGRRETNTLLLGNGIGVGSAQPPRVIVRVPPAQSDAVLSSLRSPLLKDTPAEGVLIAVDAPSALASLPSVAPAFLALELGDGIAPAMLDAAPLPGGALLVRGFGAGDGGSLENFARRARARGCALAVAIAPEDIAALGPVLRALGGEGLLATLPADYAPRGERAHALGVYRRLAAGFASLGLNPPVWVRSVAATAVRGEPGSLSQMVEAGFLIGGLLCDGVGDLVSVETEPDAARAVRLAYNVLQGAGSRITKTEYVACPGCGRTLFDLQETIRRIRSKTGHLKGVKIAIMGCIVNGPGEMADADFGYVGGAPGSINLYVGRRCVQFNIPQAEADARLIALIREHGKWVDPEPESRP